MEFFAKLSFTFAQQMSILTTDRVLPKKKKRVHSSFTAAY